jgi:hypothetical protein
VNHRVFPPLAFQAIMAIAAYLAGSVPLRAEVQVTEVEGGIRFAVDGKLFTEWRTNDWVAPYLYPVIGPTGDNITRHYPMKPGVAGEEQDHPWHRSIRFSHSDVNGYNFWWAPGKKLAGHTAEIKFAKLEKLTSGKAGEAIFWNDWLGDGKLVLRERVRLAVTPLPRGETLLDYDFELHAGEIPVTLGDKRDGGLLVRVANSMKVEDEKGNKFAGTIVNSRGDKNVDAWGKRAEWADYFGPDAGGKTVGIALFDHPSNERFPTHWHARTYGLMTANRFGTDHFKGKYGDHRTLICAPSKGANCPACASHSGDYVIQPKTSLALRHRFYFHHGDAQSADVAARYRDYTADPKTTVALLKSLMQQYRSGQLIEQFGTTDFTAWPQEFAAETREALRLRAAAYSVVKKGTAAEADYHAALKLDPKDSAAWMGLADNYANVLADGKQAVAAYRQVLELHGTSAGWMPIYATLSIAREAIDSGRPEDAFELLKQYDALPIAPVWRLRLLRTYGHAYAAQGKEAESLAKFREALELERRTAPK